MNEIANEYSATLYRYARVLNMAAIKYSVRYMKRMKGIHYEVFLESTLEKGLRRETIFL